MFFCLKVKVRIYLPLELSLKCEESILKLAGQLGSTVIEFWTNLIIEKCWSYQWVLSKTMHVSIDACFLILNLLQYIWFILLIVIMIPNSALLLDMTHKIITPKSWNVPYTFWTRHGTPLVKCIDWLRRFKSIFCWQDMGPYLSRPQFNLLLNKIYFLSKPVLSKSRALPNILSKSLPFL